MSPACVRARRTTTQGARASDAGTQEGTDPSWRSPGPPARDPPRTDARIANNLHLRVVPPGGAGQEYHGNTWAVPPDAHLSRLMAPAAAFEGVHNVEQIVVRDPASGIYDVEVIAEPFPANNFNQLRTQPFALVFVGSGPEVLFGGVPPAGPILVY